MLLHRAVSIALLLLLAAPAWGQFRDLGLEPPVCRERRSHVEQRIDELVRRHSYCRRDSDCALLDTRTACGTDCAAFVNRRSVPRLARQVRHLERRQCTGSGEGCFPLRPLCLPARPACVNNRCAALRGPFAPVVIPGAPGPPRRPQPRVPSRGVPEPPPQVFPPDPPGYVPPQRPIEGPSGRIGAGVTFTIEAGEPAP